MGGVLNACQGLGAGPNAGEIAIHNNLVVMNAVTTGSAGRGIVTEPNTGGANVDVYMNDITANNNFGIRLWQSSQGSGPALTGTIHDNIIRHIDNSYAGGIYLPENDHADVGANVNIYNNTLELSQGSGVTVDSGFGPNIYNNTFTCLNGVCPSGQWLVKTNEQPYGTSQTSCTVKNNTVPAGWSGPAVGACGTGGAITCQNTTNTTTITYCNTGTVVAGTGATLTQSCP
jgi:hypothetical protein